MHFSSVVSLHTDVYGCGVARFSEQLAQRLGVPFVRWDSSAADKGAFPLYSLKASELPKGELFIIYAPTGFGVFWHDEGLPQITAKASIVFYADPSLGSPGLWCPSLIQPVKKHTVKLFSFGMATKMQTEPYWKVRLLLESSGLPFHLRVSVGLHEGTSLTDATQHFDALKTILTGRVTILGCLSDQAVAEELANADCVIAFFEKGVRANNTTVHAALDAKVPVITNHDADSPWPLTAHTFDLWALEQWPFIASPCEPIYTWDNLITQMESIYAATVDRQPTHQR